MTQSLRRTALAAALLGLVSVSALAQRGGYYGQSSNPRYDGRFMFARIKYRGYEHFAQEGPGWAHDYPRAEAHLMRIMKTISTLRPVFETTAMEGSNILAADDPELFKYPVAYLSEPGGWHPTDSEVKALHNYLTKGGFIIFDDFGGAEDWMNLAFIMGKVLPGSRILPLPQTHAIFDSFFKIDLNVLGRGGGAGSYRGVPEYHAIYQDNDPKKRIIAVVNMNNDIGEYWEFSDQGFSPVPSNEAYKLGVNYLIYALTH